jgi:riboflavin synthase
VGTHINLERAARLGDEMGGHIVSGHVDGVGRVLARTSDAGSIRFEIGVPADLARFIAEKGSVTVDGVSLTVNAVTRETFGVNIIPHTAQHTTLGALAVGDTLHIEIDMLARYVARLVETES